MGSFGTYYSSAELGLALGFQLTVTHPEPQFM
jgi:hypothetical protein